MKRIIYHKNIKKMSTITITFGEQVENNVGMQKIGELGQRGLSYKELKHAKAKFKELGYNVKLFRLNDLLPEEDRDKAEKAYILIVKNGVQAFLEEKESVDDLLKEQKELNWDRMALMRGQVVNKHARYNLCYDEEEQDPDYKAGKGRVIKFDDIPLTKKIKSGLGDFFGDIASDLKAEGNYYFDAKSCGIGYHGDAERKIVIAIRLGETIPICYQWFHNKIVVGEKKMYAIEHGDLYAMSEKATGFDWMRPTKYTLRHAAGCKKYTDLQPKHYGKK